MIPRYVFWISGGAIVLSLGFLYGLNFTTWPDPPLVEEVPAAFRLH